MSEYMDYNEWLENEVALLNEQIYEIQNELINQQMKEHDKNVYIDSLKKELFNTYLLQQHNERLISELKEALSSYNNFVDELYPD